MPKGLPQRSASMSEDDALALRLVSLLNDDQVLDKLKSVLYPHAQAEQLKSLIENIDGLKRQITKKDEIVEPFEKRVSALEAGQDRQEQYSRRPNLRIQGLAESQEGTTDDKVLHLINTEMSFEPPLVLEDIERSHRLGHRPFTGQRRAASRTAGDCAVPHGATARLRLPRANPTEGTQQKPSRRCVHKRGPHPAASGDGVPDQEAEGGTKDK